MTQAEQLAETIATQTALSTSQNAINVASLVTAKICKELAECKDMDELAACIKKLREVCQE